MIVIDTSIVVVAWHRCSSCRGASGLSLTPSVGYATHLRFSMPEYPGLEIDHVTAESMEGLLERFGQGGMGVDVAHQFVNGEIPALCECEFG
jgi:hypothetical protein